MPDRTMRGLPLKTCPVVVLCLTLVGCGTTTDRNLGADLALYLQRANDWSPVEAETARTIDRILATQFVDEAEVRRQVVANAPRVTAHLASVEKVEPRSPELRDVHRRYVDAWRELAAGYERLIRGLDSGEVPEIAAGRRALESWREGILDTARTLRRLQQETASAADVHGRSHNAKRPESSFGDPGRLREESGGVLLSHMATMQYHRRWRA